MMADRESMATRVARRLRDSRIKAGMTVREVAACLDISHTLIVKYENGVVAPSFDRLDALARIYKLTAAALLVEHDETMRLLSALDQADTAQLTQLMLLLEQPQR
jgi:transcriptional regulator with XRE-family HTH domain